MGQKKRIAVCGYTSSVGSCFLNRNEGTYDFVRLGRRKPDICLDLRDRKLDGPIELLEGCDAIVNFAAQTVSRTYSEITDMIQTNVLGPLFLAETAREYHIGKLIHVSSISATYSEADPYYGYYAQSKKSADAFLSLFCQQNGIGCCVLRPSALFGTDDFAKHQKLLYNMIHRILHGEQITLYGSRDSFRNYVHVSTLCTVIDRCIDVGLSGVYNVVNQQNSRLTEIADALNRYYHGSSEVIFLPDKPNIEELQLEDHGEIYALLGMEAPNGFESELRRED